MITVTLQCSVILMVTVTLKCSAPHGTVTLIVHFLLVTVTLQCSVFLMVTVTLNVSALYGHCHTAVFIVPHGHCHFELFNSLCSLSHCIFQCSSWSLPLWIVQLLMVTVTPQCSVFLMVTVSLKCSETHVLCQFKVFSSFWSLTHCSVQCSSRSLSLWNVQLFMVLSLWSVYLSLFTFTAVFSAPYGHCHFEIFSPLWSLSECSVHCCSWWLSLWNFQLVMVTIILQCSVFLIVTVTLKCSAPYGHCHTAIFSVPHGHCHFWIFQLIMDTITLNWSTPYGHGHTTVYSVPYSHFLFELFSSICSLSHCIVQFFSCSL